MQSVVTFKRIIRMLTAVRMRLGLLISELNYSPLKPHLYWCEWFSVTGFMKTEFELIFFSIISPSFIGMKFLVLGVHRISVSFLRMRSCLTYYHKDALITQDHDLFNLTQKCT